MCGISRSGCQCMCNHADRNVMPRSCTSYTLEQVSTASCETAAALQNQFFIEFCNESDLAVSLSPDH